MSPLLPLDCLPNEMETEEVKTRQPLQQESVEPQVRRSTREHRASSRYPTSESLLLTDEGEPESFQEAQSHNDRVSWMKAMQEEMNSLQW